METEEFANIDDLLGGDNDDEEDKHHVQEPDQFVTSEQEPDICDDEGFDDDGITESHEPTTETPADTPAPPSKDEAGHGVFSSNLLEDVLEKDSELVGSVPVPRSLAWRGFSETTSEVMEKISEQLERNEEGISAGLGQKKKTEQKMRMQGRMMGGGGSVAEDISSNRAKTLAEKRTKLREDILKYGVAAIEKLYPRQGGGSAVKRTGGTSSRKSSFSRNTTFKLKPAPHVTNSAEIDAWKILRPYSHDKYIKHPDHNPVVYIQRRHGLVPLSTLGRQSSGATLMPSASVHLLRRRNHNLGKPGHFVREGGRLVGVGGTRSKLDTAVKIHTLPSFERRRPVMTPFMVDHEFAKFAVSAVSSVSSVKVDIRQLKRNEAMAQVNMAKQIEEKPLLDKMLFKMKQNELSNDGLVSRDLFSSCMESYKNKRKKKETHRAIEDSNSVLDEFKSFNLGIKDKDYMNFEENDNRVDIVKEESIIQPKPKEEFKNEIKTEECNNLEIDNERNTIVESAVTRNTWNQTPKNVVPKELNLDECPPLCGYREGSIRNLVPKPVKVNFDGYTGYDVCDVEDCVICQESDAKLDDSRASAPTEHGTPGKSGSQTPSGSKHKPQRIAKDLQRVKRALKTLGVNIIEYDEDGDLGECLKDYCKLGCICDSLRTKQLPPSHCGKVDCMTACCCSKEALKYSSCGSRRVNISAAVGARIMEDTQRGMAAEERKFSNTVVVTADKDTVMLGGRGTRRERKIPQRYQNSNTLMLDVAGKEYVQKEESSESEDEEDVEDSLEDAYDKLRKLNDLQPCTVIVPLVNLPASTSIWCMYHAQYSCPCSKYKNPLDFAPDIETGDLSVCEVESDTSSPKKRKVSQDVIEAEAKKPKSRMVGPKSKVKKMVDDDEEPLLGVEDIDPDYQKPLPSSVRHPLSAPAAQRLKMTQSARTKPVTSKPSFKTKMIVKPVKKAPKNSKIPDLVKLVGDDEDEDNENNLEISHELNLDITNMSSLQYVRWDIIKSKFQSQDIDLYFWVRPGRGRNILFLTQFGEKPYVATAINLRNIQGSTQNLPSLVSDCVEAIRDRDKGRYCVLECNGTVWTIKRLMAIRGQKDLGFSVETNTATSKEVQSDKTKTAQKDSSIKISLDEQVQKLPVGQSLITVVEGPGQKAIMQVKLPPTLTSQYWSLISVGQGQASIQCPDSSLVLKCAILQQAANLSTATATTVRIPIPVSDQDPSFGVYAVPGLKSHVFVGPFTAPKTDIEDDDDIVCLEDEEVKVVEPNKEEADSQEEVEKQKEEKKEISMKRKLLGQIPLIVEKSEVDDDIDIEDVDPHNNSQAKILKKKSTKEAQGDTSDKFIELRPSEHGQIVHRITKRNLDSLTAADIQYKFVDEEKSFTGYLESSGKVILPHPKSDAHEVHCPDKESASKWLEEHFAAEIEEGEDEEVVFEDPEPLPSVPPKVKTPPPILKRLKTPLLSSGKSNKKIALFVQLKQQKDEAQLFYELGHTAFNKFFKKNVSRAQILKKAQEEIKSLQEEGREMENSKQSLLKRRTKLFELFTKSLNGLPVAKKKAAVIELKELLRKDKERKDAPPAVPASANPTSKVVAQPQKKASPPKAQSQAPGSTPYTDVTGINTKRSDGSVLRPMNAFMLWAKDRRSALLAQGYGISQVSQVRKNTIIRFLAFIFLIFFFIHRYFLKTGNQCQMKKGLSFTKKQNT